MIRESNKGFEPSEPPTSVTIPQLLEELSPVSSIEIEGEGLWTGAIGRFLRIVVREERSAKAVVHANEPKHERGIVRRREARIGQRQPNGECLVTPVRGQSGSLPGTTWQGEISGLGKDPAFVPAQGIATGEVSLEPRVRFADIV